MTDDTDGDRPEGVRTYGFADTEAQIVAEALLVYADALGNEATSLHRRGHGRTAGQVEADRDTALLLRQRVLR